MSQQKSITPLSSPISATLQMPGSKSYTNRALVMAAFTEGAVVLHNPLYSADTMAMIDCLRTLGLRIEATPQTLLVRDSISCIEEKEYELCAQDSGTTVRFLLALLCTVPGKKFLWGSQRLQERPIADLVDALRTMGAVITYCAEEGKLPVAISSTKLTGSSVAVNSSVSSQFCSALLLIAPALPVGLTVDFLGKPVSKPYVEMTVQCMRDWGIAIEKLSDTQLFVPPHQHYRKKDYVIEGDFSSASYFLAIAALTHSTFHLKNLNPLSQQADCRFMKMLADMGNKIFYTENSICIEGKNIAPVEQNMEDCPDQVMTMAILAAFARGITCISGVRSLRVKESDRIAAVKKGLHQMGIRTEETRDTLTIYGGFPHGAIIDSCQDHRIAMAFAVAGTKLPGMAIRDPHVVEKTFPTFWNLLEGLK